MDITAFAELLTARGQRLLPGSHAVPVEIVAEQPDGSIARFTARGTTIRLALYAAGALGSLVLPTECGCGRYHEPAGPARLQLRADATPYAERLIDGRAVFGWTHHEAGLLPLSTAATYYFELLAMLTVDTLTPAAP